jgi:energy-coupling factor transporter ATP-binding protein EcfA2
MENGEKITYFAKTDSRGKEIPFGIKAKDRSRHVYVIGKTGMGKSTLLENMAIQDIKNSEGFAFIDPHGKTAELLLDYVPKERMKDVIYFAPFDMDHPISFNVMEDVGYDKRHLVVSGLMSAFKKIWVDAWSGRMEYILTNTLLALLEYPDATLLGVNRMYADKEYRKKVVANISDPIVKAFWTEEFAKYTDRYTQEATPAIQNKVGQFTSNPLIRNIIGQPKSSFDFREIMDEKKIIIMNLSKGRMGEVNANLLGSMIITKIYLAAMSRAEMNDEEVQKLPDFYLFVDEFQSFANESFADILSEARKYKLSLTIAHQYIEQMSEEVQAAVFGNVGTMITFRVGAYDAEVLEKEFAPTFNIEDLVNLGFVQIYLKLMIDGVSSPPFSATTLPPIKKPGESYKERIIEYSRKNYSKPRLKIEENIKNWHGPEKSEGSDQKVERRSSESRNKRRDDGVRREERKIKEKILSEPSSPDDFEISAKSLRRKDNSKGASFESQKGLREALGSIISSNSSKSKDESIDKDDKESENTEIKPNKTREIPETELKKILDVE